MFELDIKERIAKIKKDEASAAKDMEDARAQDLETDLTESGVIEILEGLNGQAE